MSPQRSSLDIDGLTAGYGGPAVLENVVMRVAQGEAVAVLGANGAGKTTLIRAVCGFADVYAGNVRVDGQSLAGMKPYQVVRTGVVQVPEGRRLFPSLSVERNLRVALYARRSELTSDRSIALLDEAYDLFPRLKDRCNQSAGNLSGGEQQMLSIARALMVEPRFLLLDEPSTGLAPILVDLVFETVEKLANDKRLGLFLVEQNAIGALEVSDRAYILRSGMVVAEGTTQELVADDRLVASYLGGSAVGRPSH